jgi:hypothetical protein
MLTGYGLNAIAVCSNLMARKIIIPLTAALMRVVRSSPESGTNVSNYQGKLL